MRLLAGAVVGVYFAALALLSVYSLHRLYLLGLALAVRRRRSGRPALWSPRGTGWGSGWDGWPDVTVQLPIYNERFVVDRLLEAVGRLEYPRSQLEVQVLDDSTDATSAAAARGVRRLQQQGIRAAHLRRAGREGYKAGALAAGLQEARGEFLLVLDADFVPQPDLLLRLLPPFEDPNVAVVQARWGHLNAERNRLTRAQALFLDAHFLLETGTRAAAGLFFNFNGTAGMWRKSAIADAGGWQGDTLTEDLDLSYRAQMRGWRFVFLPDLVVPGELPETLAAFKQQQARWAQGTAATCRKLLPSLLRGAWPAAIKLEATAHLTAHVVFPCTLTLAVTMAPALALRRAVGWEELFWLDLLLATAALLPVSIFYRVAARLAGRRAPAALGIPILLLHGVALCISNTRAAWAGLRARRAAFLRTPKAVPGTGPRRGVPRTYRVHPSRGLRWVEGGLAVYLLAGLVFAAAHEFAGATPFLLLLALGFGSAAVRN